MSEETPEQRPDETNTGLSNRALGLILAFLVLAWFIIGITYAAMVNYSG